MEATLSLFLLAFSYSRILLCFHSAFIPFGGGIRKQGLYIISRSCSDSENSLLAAEHSLVAEFPCPSPFEEREFLLDLWLLFVAGNRFSVADVLPCKPVPPPLNNISPRRHLSCC